MADPKTSTPPAAAVTADQPGAALDAAIRAALLRDPVLTAADGTLHALLPKDFALAPLPDDRRLASHPAGAVTVDDRASLSAYANRYSTPQESILVADIDAGKITARLDWHRDNADARVATGAARHSVTLALRDSEEFRRWNAVQGKLMAQDEFARFLEENASDIASPDPATMIEISRDFEATSGQTYKSSTRLDNGDRRIVFEADTRAANEVIVPQKFTLNIPIWHGEEPDLLTCLFRWRAQGNAVQFGFQWHRVDYQRRAHFALIARTAAEETGLPLFFGRIT